MTHTVILASEAQRVRARALVDRAPLGYVVTVAEPRRSVEQNAKMHAMLTDVSVARPEGRRHIPDVWKAIFMQACGHEQQFEAGLDGRPFPMGFRSSRLSKAEMSDMIERIYAYGAEHGVAWSEPGSVIDEARARMGEVA